MDLPAKRARIINEMEAFSITGIALPETQLRIERLVINGIVSVEMLLDVGSASLLNDICDFDLQKHHYTLLNRIIQYWSVLDVKELPPGFFSVDRFMAQYLIAFLDGTSNIVENIENRLKCVLKFLICTQEPEINFSKSQIHFILELMHYFPSATREDILPRIIPILKCLLFPDHEFWHTLFKRIFEDSNIKNSRNLVANLRSLGDKRISFMKGSELATFLVFLSKWYLLESTLRNISEILMMMPKERVNFLTRVLIKLKDEYSVSLFLNKISDRLDSSCDDHFIFYAKVVEKLND
jgi:hypothetical protein